MEDKRFSEMQVTLDNTMANIQNLHIQSTGGNIMNLRDAIIGLQTVYNTLSDIIKEQAAGGVTDGRETDTK